MIRDRPPFRADAVSKEVARDLENGIAHEEEAGTKGVRSCANAEVGLELLLGEGDVAPIQERDHVHQQQEWNQTAEYPPVRCLSQIVATPRGLHGGQTLISPYL
jgi:hypothetical protein